MASVTFISRRREPITLPDHGISFLFMGVSKNKVRRWSLELAGSTRTFTARAHSFPGNPHDIQAYIVGMPPEAAKATTGRSLVDVFRQHLTPEDEAACARLSLKVR